MLFPLSLCAVLPSEEAFVLFRPQIRGEIQIVSMLLYVVLYYRVLICESPGTVAVKRRERGYFYVK